jgi:N4-gp56 family major capsid protein
MDVTTRGSDVTAEVNYFYDRTLLERAVPAFLYNRFAQVRDIPGNSGTDSITFRRYGALTAQTTALTEGVTPTGKALSITDVHATVLQYGDFVVLTDKLQAETIDPILTETAQILGEQVGESLDDLAGAVLSAGDTAQYASTATQTSEVSSTMKLTRLEVKEMVRTLRGNNAKPVTSMIDPSTGFNTIPVAASFIGIVDEDTLYDLEDAEGWIPVEKYPNRGDVMQDEKGSLAGVRFLMSTNAYVEADAGVGTIDVHFTIIFGQNAYAQSRISTETLQNIVKPLGSAGSADPLNQRSTSGWKLSYVCKIIQQGYIGRIEHAVSS